MDYIGCNQSGVLESALFYFSNGLQPVLIRAKQKRPFENEWQKKEYKTEEDIRKAFEKHEGNIGIRGGVNGLMIIDCDDVRFRENLLLELPMLADTLQSKGKKETGHFWVRLTTTLKKESIRLHFDNKTKQTFADCQGNGAQVVVSPSIHPEGMQYVWLNNNPILPLDTDVFLTALDNICLAIGTKNPYRKTIIAPKAPTRSEKSLFEAVKERVRLSDVLNARSETMNCIFHKETTPTQALRLYRDTDTVYCFSCGKSADVIGINAQINGISQYQSALNLAEKYGILEPQNPLESASIHVFPSRVTATEGSQSYRHFRHEPPTNLVETATDVKNGVTATSATSAKSCAITNRHTAKPYMAVMGDFGGWRKEPEQAVTPTKLKDFNPSAPKTWIVNNVLGAGTLAVLGGKRATFKSTISVNLIVRAAAGLSFLGHKIEKPIPVLYMDEENGDAHLADLMKWSVKSLPEGTGTLCGDNVNIICSEGVGHLWATLESFSPDAPDCPKLIILDGLRRFLGSANENDAGEVSVFMQKAKIEAERLGACILFLHHARKSQSGGNRMDEFEDAMDSLRGSSDIMAAVSTAMITTRVGDSTRVLVSFPKTRWGKEPEPVAVDFDISENTITMSESIEQNQQDFIMSQHAQTIRRWAIQGGYGEFTTEQAKAGLSGRMPVRTVERVLSWMAGTDWIKKPKRGVYQIEIPERGQQTINKP